MEIGGASRHALPDVTYKFDLTELATPPHKLVANNGLDSGINYRLLSLLISSINKT